MKTIAAALLAAVAQAGASTPASEVCIANDAGFLMQFHLKDIDTGVVSESSERYNHYKTSCMKIDEMLEV